MPKKEEEQSAKVVRYLTGILLGGMVAFAVSLVLLFGASLLVSSGRIAEERMGQVTVAACVIGAFCGGIFAVRQCQVRALAVGLATGGVFFLLLLTIGVVAFQAVPQENGFVLLLGCLCGGAAAGLLCRMAKPKKKRRK